MSYKNPSPHEIRISEKLEAIAAQIGQLFIIETGANVDFVLCVSSKSERETLKSSDMTDAPVGSYVSTFSRETSAILMCELIAKWHANKELAPIHELRDANGNTLSDILGMGPH